MNYINGDQLESHNSKVLHGIATPMLLSETLLRELGGGQVDLCIYLNSEVIMFEVKSSPELIGKKQRRRLYNSLDFITQVMQAKGRLCVIKKLPKDISFLNLNT